jgi:hypothetical protein
MGILSRVALAIWATLWLTVAPAFAAHIFVSQFGSDTTGNGSPNAPFKTLQRAVNAAQDNDVIQLEMGGNYGPATITNKTLTIMSTEGGGIFEPGMTAITYNGAAGDILTLIGLTIDQGGSPFNGIVFNLGLKLIMMDMLIQNGSGGAYGVLFQPTTNAELHIRDSTVAEFGATGAGAGIRVVPRNGADVIGSIRNCTLLNNLVALFVLAGLNSFNDMVMNPSYIGGGGTAVTSSGAGSTVRIKESIIANNVVGLNRPNSGKIVSLGGNSVYANSTFSSVIPQQ